MLGAYACRVGSGSGVCLVSSCCVGGCGSQRHWCARGHPGARRHFDSALEHYRSGDYEQAATQLRLALELDPDGRDLVYNLGLVYEKLGQVDQAIEQFERLLELERDPAEIRRVLQALRRLRDARAARVGQPARQPKCPRPRPPPRPPEAAWTSRVGGWTIAAGSAAVVATVAAVVLGVTALLVHPGSEPETSPGTSVDRLQTRADVAHSMAVAADISFAVGFASAATALALQVASEPAAPAGDGARAQWRQPSVAVQGRF
jgi:tetratricopeptide (TPR) repeat protein